MKIFNSRKAAVEISLTQVIGLVLALVVVIVGIGILTGMLNLFIKSPDEGTEAQYNKLFTAIETLYHPSNQNQSCKLPIGYIEPGFALVGFNNDKTPCVDCNRFQLNFVEEHCGIDNNVYRPMSCLDRACLCLCHGGTGDVTDEDCFSGKCKRLNEDISKLVTFYDDKQVDLVLYGESCWAGVNHDVIGGYFIKKEGSGLVTIKAIFGETEFAQIQAPNCEDIIRAFKPAQNKPAEEQGPQGPAVEESIDKIELN